MMKLHAEVRAMGLQAALVEAHGRPHRGVEVRWCAMWMALCGSSQREEGAAHAWLFCEASPITWSMRAGDASVGLPSFTKGRCNAPCSAPLYTDKEQQSTHHAYEHSD